MQRFTSKLLKPFNKTPISRSRTPTIDEHAAGEHEEWAAYQGDIVPASEEGTGGNLSAHERLDRLSSFRIQPSTLEINSESSSRSGGKADVVRGTFRRGNESDGQMVAVKKVRYYQNINKRKFCNEFVHEVDMMAKLSHENIIRLIGFIEDLERGKAWIVLSWEPNGNLSEFLAAGEWEIPERVSLIKDTFEGIKYLHTRKPPICHGDLKSFNILVSASYCAVITDFGSARTITQSSGIAVGEERDRQEKGKTVEDENTQICVAATGNQLTLTGPAWSLRWAPPEVVNGSSPDLASDIWAAGWVCWEVMTNKLPFSEIDSVGRITLMVIQGKVPSARDDVQLAQIIRLCSLMADCWSFGSNGRPSIDQCCNRVKWLPSIRPSSRGHSGSTTPSSELLLEMGRMHSHQSSYTKAISLLQQALSLAEVAGDQHGIAAALDELGDSYYAQRKYTQAVQSYTRAHEIFARIGDDLGQANTLWGLGLASYYQSDYTRAEESYSRAREIYARAENDLGQARSLWGLAEVSRSQSKYAQAEESYNLAREMFARVGADLGLANAFWGLGAVYLRQSKYTLAEEAYAQAQEIYARVGNSRGLANALHGLGDVYHGQSKYIQAEESYARAREISARIGKD